MTEFEDYLYYIFVFFGLILILGILIFISYQVTSKKK
jgi:hypothetical protein